MNERDVAIVLSGGGMNGVLLELGFLKRLRDSSLWPRVGRIYGTSAGALTQTIQVANAGLATYVVTGLSSGSWFFAVRAYNNGGAESANSNVVSKTIP